MKNWIFPAVVLAVIVGYFNMPKNAKGEPSNEQNPLKESIAEKKATIEDTIKSVQEQVGQMGGIIMNVTSGGTVKTDVVETANL